MQRCWDAASDGAGKPCTNILASIFVLHDQAQDAFGELMDVMPPGYENGVVWGLDFSRITALFDSQDSDSRIKLKTARDLVW
jgi:hypothetical protein